VSTVAIYFLVLSICIAGGFDQDKDLDVVIGEVVCEETVARLVEVVWVVAIDFDEVGKLEVVVEVDSVCPEQPSVNIVRLKKITVIYFLIFLRNII